MAPPTQNHPRRQIDPAESSGHLLWRGFLAWQRSLSAALLPHGLTQPLFSILAAAGWLTWAGGAVSQQRIADHAGMDRMHISGLVRKLEAMGLLARVPSQRDKRAMAVSLTHLGRETLSRAMATAANHDAAFFAENPALDPRR